MFELTSWKERKKEYIVCNESNKVIIYSRKVKQTGKIIVQIKLDNIGSTTRYSVNYFHNNIKKFANKYEESIDKSKLRYDYGRDLKSIDILKLEVTMKLKDYFLIKTL